VSTIGSNITLPDLEVRDRYGWITFVINRVYTHCRRKQKTCV